MHVTVMKPSYDETTQTLYFNKVDNMPVAKHLWDFEIGTYKTIKQVLRTHENKLLDLDYFSQVLDFIQKSIDIVDEISSIDIIS